MVTKHIDIVTIALSRSVVLITATFPDSRPKLHVYCNGVEYLYTQSSLFDYANLPDWVNDEVAITSSGVASDLYREVHSELVYVDLDGAEHKLINPQEPIRGCSESVELAEKCIHQYIEGTTAPTLLSELHKMLIPHTIQALEEHCGLTAPKNKHLH